MLHIVFKSLTFIMEFFGESSSQVWLASPGMPPATAPVTHEFVSVMPDRLSRLR
jgi:hypothetical protein